MTSTHLHRAQIIALILTFILIAGSGLILIVGTASAQENSTESDTADTNNDNGEQASEQNSDEEQAYEYIFPGDNLRIVDSHWDGKTLVATFEAVNMPERITVTDGGRTADNNENVELDRQGYTIGTSGTTEVRFTVVEDRQVTIDDGTTLLLKGYAPDRLTAPSIGEVAAMILGLIAPIVGIVALKLRDDRRHQNSPRRVF
jgi:hypothetical protein